MRKRLCWLVVGIALGALVPGCGSSEPARAPADNTNDANPLAPIRPREITNAALKIPPALEALETGSLADLLSKPRTELAARAEECLQSIQALEKHHREDKLPFLLLMNARLPRVVPVFREAKYSERLGFSVPPYVGEDARDLDVALHLARFGDVDAGHKLVDPADSAVHARLEALRLERNYPVEWTRLVGMLLYRAQFLFAADHGEYGKKLIIWHKQLSTVLGAQARTSPLGAALLPRGSAVLAQAAEYFRANQQTAAAQEIESALADWGEPARLALPLTPGALRSEVERLFGCEANGKAIVTRAPLRALDLLQLPFPAEGLDGIVACLDANDRLAEVLLSYGPRTADYYLQPQQLAHWLEESKHPQKAVATQAQSLPRRIYLLNGPTAEVSIVPAHPLVGALVRISNEKPAPAPTLTRDLGAIHLDRSFEQIRQRLALQRRVNPLQLEDEKDLALITHAAGAGPPVEAVLQRAKTHDLLESVTLRFDSRQTEKRTLVDIAGRLWTLGGAAWLDADRDSRKGHLTFLWEDRQTRCILKLPSSSERGAELFVADHRDAKHFAERLKLAQAFDQAERKARFETKALVTRLPRELAGVGLGMSRAQLAAALGRDDKTIVKSAGDDVIVTWGGEPPAEPAVLLRELAARCDVTGRVAELRFRLSDRPVKPGAVTQLLDKLRREGGAAEAFQAPWSLVWSDLPPSKPAPVFSRWHDDTTMVTWQQDSHGVEVTFRDRPPEHEGGLPLSPLSYLPRGPEGLPLATERADVYRQWKIPKPAKSGEMLVLGPQQPSPYDALLVWFEKDQVVRIVARHKGRDLAKAAPEKLARALQDAWSQRLSDFGWPRRQDHDAARVLVSWGNHDDRTRLRVFWQQNADGSRELFTEWKNLGQ